MSRSARYRPWLLMGLALFLAAASCLWMNSLPLFEHDAVYADTTVRLTASRGAVLFSGDCVFIQWRVSNALRVLVNGELVDVASEKTLCVSSETQPTFQIMLMDGSEVALTHRIAILTAQPLFLTFAFITIGLFCLGLSLLLLRLFRAIGRSSRFSMARVSGRAAFTVLLSLLITLLSLELVFRIYLEANGSRDQKVMYLYSLEEIRGLQSAIIHVPYISYVPDPAYEGHNRLGYRGPEIAIPKPAGAYRIVAMGGSTTYSSGTAAEESYPAFLQTILRDEYKYANVEVINAGMNGYTSWEILSSFAFRALELEPDMLIYYGALNDLVVRERNSVDCYRGFNPQRGLNGHRGLFVERSAELPASALYRLLAIQLQWLKNPLALDSSFEPTRINCEPDPGGMTLEKRLATNAPVYYERNIRNLIALARANGVQPVISSWVYNVAAERPQLWRQSIAQHNAVTRQIARELEIPYIDLATDFPVNNAYWERDGIHLLAAGTFEQASRYAAFLDENGLLPKPG